METSAAVRPIPGSTSDDLLVASVRAGSEAAFEVLYDRHLRGILGFCRHMLGSAEEAEDAVQHTFMAAYRDLVGSHKPVHLRPWLYTIARNRCFTLLRGRVERVLAELGACSHDEIGTVLGVPRDKVKALVFQGRSSLIASREARDTPCTEIRPQLERLRAGPLRRTTLRRHLRECAGCRGFRTDLVALTA